ncbi:MAG: ABC-F family ATP-binding cassette domain-containing protein [Bacteroidales bacterium]|nr:ABC-F family ATP-binding cassette domain-containing protein [Bacteroidales bacterium]
MITINNVTKEFGGTPIFTGVTFHINPRDRIGLAGMNGAGKTTLLKILNGLIQPDNGSVAVPPDHSAGYLPQEKKIFSQLNIVDETMLAVNFIAALETESEKIQLELGAPDYNEKIYTRKLSRLEEINAILKYYTPERIRGDAERYLTGLGFAHSEFTRPMMSFSQGWQMRVELAKLLLLQPSLLLLDEPTNHLDIESIQWLEDFLINYTGAVVVVSHDRTLLDHVTNRTIEINNGKAFDYAVSYSKYIELRNEREEQTQATYDNQQKQIKEIERFVERFRYKASKAKQVQSRVKLLQKMDTVELENLDKSSIYFKFPPPPHSGKITVEGSKLTKKYGDKVVLNSIDFQILRGEKVAFVGRNGEGKSTLAKMIADNLQHEGTLKHGHQVKVGYFAQDQNDRMDQELTVFDTIDQVAVGDIRPRIRDILGSFLFRGDDLDKKVKVLSGGEKSRLSLVRLLLSPSNFLLLDEPTNHLDIQSKEILKAAIMEFTGTVVIVSHDRDFLQGLTSRLYEFKNGKIKEHLGDISTYLEKRKIEGLTSLEYRDPSITVEPKAPTENKIKRELKKEQDKELRKIEKEIKLVEDSIHQKEKELELVNQRLSQPTLYPLEIQSGELFKKHDQLDNELFSLMEKWEILQTNFENAKSVEP